MQTCRLFIDLDTDKNLENLLWSTPEDAEIEAKRLQQLIPNLGKALIYRSDNGYHIIFPDAKLTRQQVEAIITLSQAHKGWIYFSLLIQDCTLRISPKPVKGSHPPYLIKVIPPCNQNG